MALVNISKRKNSQKDNDVLLGVSGFILSLIGLLLALNFGTENLFFYLVFIVMIIIGIIMVARSLSN